VTDLAALEPAPGAGIAGAVAALPALPAAQAGERYGVRQLTITWLGGFAAHTRTAYFRDLAHYLAWCQRQGLDPGRARISDLDHYRLGLEQPAHGRPLSPASVHRRLSALSSWYRYLQANADHEIGVNPLAGIRRPRVDRDASTTAGLTAEQVGALLRSAEARVHTRTAELARSPTPTRQARVLAALRDRALARMLADLGLRVGEALGLDVTSLSYNQGRRTVRYRGKGGRQRERPLSAGVSAALDDYLGRRGAIAQQPVESLTGPLFATNAREIGIPLEDVQDAMGHADARTTRRYDRGRHALHRDPALKLGDLYKSDLPDAGR
jgi:integrase/recombinase XerD